MPAPATIDAVDAIDVRRATPDDAVGVRRVIDAAALDASGVDSALAAGDVFLAERERVVGAVVLGSVPESVARTVPGEPTRHLRAIAVVRRLRDRGIGSVLVRAVLDHADSVVTARFRERVAPFYRSLGFTIQSGEAVGPETDDRLVGWRDPDD